MSLDKKDADYMRIRGIVLDRCRELNEKKQQYIEAGFLEDAQLIQEHVDLVLSLMQMCDEAN